MIKANELRTSIWVIIDSDKVRLDEDALEVIFAARNYSDLQPIPLTPQILIACGFKIRFPDSKDCNIWDLNVSEDWKLNGSVAIFEDGSAKWLSCPGSGFKYLHQLQNLYFTITDTELTVNL